MMRRVNIFCSFALLFASHNSLAVTYPLPPEGSRLVGQSFTVTVPDHNTQPLETFAAQYGQGLSNMLEANPGADVFLPKSGSQLTIPQQLILPVNKNLQPGRQRRTLGANMRNEGRVCPHLFLRGPIIPWGCTRFILAGCMPSTVPMPILVLDFG